jgi:5'-phosphate synthase pdxT subunit
MIIGILALQGAFIEHKNILDKLNVKNILIKKKEDIDQCDGIIIPGGESTSMSIIETDIFREIRNHIDKGKAIWGTCAGMILLSNDIVGCIDGQKNIGGLDVQICRNFFGSQMNSFIQKILYPVEFKKEGYFNAVFIRAPIVGTVKNNVNILSKLSDETIVAVQQNNILGTSFHPELTNDYSWHEYFLNICISLH